MKPNRLIALLLALPVAGSAQSISLNFGANEPSGTISTSSSLNAGAVPVPGTRWSNASGVTGTLSGLPDAAGNVTTASVTWASKNTWRSGSAGATATSLNGTLLKGYLDDGTSATLPNGATATISNIPYLTYEAYVYYASDLAGAGENLANGYRPLGLNGANYTWNGTATVVGTANWTGKNWTDDDTLAEGSHYLKVGGQKSSVLAVTPNAGATGARASVAGIQLKDTYTGTLAYWDVNGATVGAGGATPSGNWTDANWSATADGSGATAAWTPGTTAVFSAGTDATGTYSVALGSPQSADAVWVRQGSLSLTGSALTVGGTGLLRADGVATLSVASDLNATTLTTAGAVTLSGANTVTGGLVLASGTLTLAGDLTSTTPGAGFGGVLSGGGTLLKQSPGTLKLTAINSFSGPITVAAGTLEAGIATTTGDASALGSGASTLNVNAGATLLFSTGSRTAGYHRGAVNVRGGTITFNTDDNSLASGNTLTFDIAPGTINGSGLWRMRDANATVAVTAAGSGSTISVASLRLTTSNGNHTFNIADGANAADLTVSSIVSGHFGGEKITKSGAGTLVLSGNNTYTGGTTVSAGTLLLMNAAGSGAGTGATTVATGATLGGTGTASGVVTVSGTLAPGSGIGTLSTGALTLAAGSSAAFEVATSTGLADAVHVTGDVTLGGGALNLTDLAPGVATSKITLITYTGALTGTFNGLAEGATVNVGANAFVLHYNDGKAVTLSLSDAYSTWAAGRGLNGADASRTADTDRDGMKNVFEFIFGSEPNPAHGDASSTAAFPISSLGAGTMSYYYPRTQTSVGVADPVVQYSSDLSAWTPAVDGVNGVVIQVIPNGFAPGIDIVGVDIPRSLSSSGRLFVRMVVANP